MPKDEFDPEDPMELCGVGLITQEDTSEAMTDCFIEEFMRLGYNHKQLLALFRNPHYVGVNMVLQNKGEQFVRDRIADAFAAWGRPIVWNSAREDEVKKVQSEESRVQNSALCTQHSAPKATDPMGNIIPAEVLTALEPAPPRSCGSGGGTCTCGERKS